MALAAVCGMGGWLVGCTVPLMYLYPDSCEFPPPPLFHFEIFIQPHIDAIVHCNPCPPPPPSLPSPPHPKYLYEHLLVSIGKTLLAKAVANQTSATFLRVCGSELIQKYLVCAILHILHALYTVSSDCHVVDSVL